MSKIEALSMLIHAILISIFIGIMTRPLVGLTVFLAIDMLAFLIQYGVHYAKKN